MTVVSRPALSVTLKSMSVTASSVGCTVELRCLGRWLTTRDVRVLWLGIARHITVTDGLLMLSTVTLSGSIRRKALATVGEGTWEINGNVLKVETESWRLRQNQIKRGRKAANERNPLFSIGRYCLTWKIKTWSWSRLLLQSRASQANGLLGYADDKSERRSICSFYRELLSFRTKKPLVSFQNS